MSPIYRLLFLFAFALMFRSAFGLEVKVTGSNDDALADNIAAHLSVINLSAPCISDSAVATIEKSVGQAAQAFGYYKTQINHLSVDNEITCESLSMTIDAGPRVRLGDVNIAITGAASDDLELQQLIADSPLESGEFLNHAEYTSEKRKWLANALRRGYFDATFSAQRIAINRQENAASIDLILNSGDRYRFGPLRQTETLIGTSLVKQVMPYEEGDYYHADQLAVFNQNLKLTGYFQQVVARPILKDATNEQIPIDIIATAKPRHIYNIGGGASTNTGPRLRLKWQRPWLNSAGHSMSAEAFFSAPLQTATYHYKIPLEDPLKNYLSLQAGLRVEDDNDTKSEAVAFAIQRHWGNEENDWQKIAFLRYEQERFTQATSPTQTTSLLIPGATVSRHRTRGGLDVYWGDQQLITVETASSKALSDIDFSRITVQSKWVRSFGKHRIFMRAELGAINTNDFSRVPSSLRYFTGGDQSVRGFAYQSLSPEVDGELIGGKYLSAASVEYSYPINEKWRLATFIDSGNASREPFKNLARSAGIGASWLSPVGPIRLYLAWGKSSNDNTFRVHFSMGPTL